MGMVFGKIDVAEPTYNVLASNGNSNNNPSSSHFSWEVRQYGKRFAIEAEYPSSGDGSSKKDDDRTPFMELAGYIGVMGPAQNEGSTKIAMTAPVAIENEKGGKGGGGTKIAMTAPVAIEGGEKDGDSSSKKMQFFLPAEYDDLSKIPKPSNPDVKVVQVPPEAGAVHRYNGKFSPQRSREIVTGLVTQLGEDGLALNEKEKDTMLADYKSFGYNPPFTIPHFRRNEVWVPLTESQVQELTKLFPESGGGNGTDVKN